MKNVPGDMDQRISRTRRAAMAALILLAGLLALAAGKGAAHQAPRTVVLLSMDGVRWDYPLRDHLPAFEAMARNGLRAGRMIPPFPSLTFVSHTTIATGCYPDKHGIVANSFLDPSRHRRFSEAGEASWLKEPPLWALAADAGLKTAVDAWPCSGGAYHGIRPTYYKPYGDGGSDGGTVTWILDLLARPDSERPRLIMAWTHGADHAGHAEGPDGPAVHEAMKRADALLARLRKGIKALGSEGNVDLIVLSDHGMARVHRTVDVVKYVPKKGFFPYVATSGPVCNVYVRGEPQRRAVARALTKLPKGIEVFTKADCPADLHYGDSPRAGDFILLAAEGTTFRSFYQRTSGDAPAGMHGYLPRIPDMGGIFYAEGPGIPRGKELPEVRAVDVAPSVCAMLGIETPAGMDGRAVGALAGR
jgi:predicted AlkP superfamily pyrophosphatase or phosphodiesterase